MGAPTRSNTKQIMSYINTEYISSLLTVLIVVATMCGIGCFVCMLSVAVQTDPKLNSIVQRWINKFYRLKYTVLTFRDYAKKLNRSVEVQDVLVECGKGKREMLTKDECLELVRKLGVPEEIFGKPQQNTQ